MGGRKPFHNLSWWGDLMATLGQCLWPTLSERYAAALREAVRYVLERFEPQGILVSGTIIRGNPHPASDLDIYVIHDRAWRQRIQRFFNGVPAEIFVNPLQQIDTYFREERSDGRPSTAHMFATGFIVLDQSGDVARLQAHGRQIVDVPPDQSEAQLTWLRYAAATAYEDAVDIAGTHPENASMILSVAVFDMLRYAFLSANRPIPRHKSMLADLAPLNPATARLAHEFYNASTHAERIDIAGKIADLTLQTRGFFEWESQIQGV